MKSFGNHIDPEKEEQLKLAKIEAANKVKKILKLAKGINGNKDVNSKKKSEIIHLIEDFHQHYESLYSQYEELRGEVKNNVNGGDDGSSTTPSDTESYYSPDESTYKTSRDDTKTSDVEDTILKDILTSSSEVKEATSFGSQSEEFNEIFKDLTVQNEDSQRLAHVKELEEEIVRLKSDMETVCSEKQQWEEQVECKSNEATQMKERISGLEARILELEATCKEKESVQLEENLKKRELEQMSLRVEGLKEQVDSLQQELVIVNSRKAELELEIKKKPNQTSDKSTNLEANRSDVEKMELQRKISQLQASLSESEKELSAQQKKFKVCQNILSAQIESLNGKVKNQEALLKERNSLQAELEALRNDKKRYLMELETVKQDSLLSKSKMEKKNTELTNKIANQQKTLLELGDAVRDLKAKNEQAHTKFISDSKPNFQQIERKIDEMAEEFRKQFEDKYRILSRRIRVAEQLHVENKECYTKAKEAYEQEIKDLHGSFVNIKAISITANDVLISLDSVTLKFEERNANFLNRISKASCELKFMKDWVVRKNKELIHVKDDQDGLLSQLDDKEGEIVTYRERVWKSENKLRVLEKMIKQRENGMLVLQEEKREAIRQLCVWIDYHRSRSEYYKKILFDQMKGSKKAS